MLDNCGGAGRFEATAGALTECGRGWGEADEVADADHAVVRTGWRYPRLAEEEPADVGTSGGNRGVGAGTGEPRVPLDDTPDPEAA